MPQDVIVTDTSSVNISQLKNMARSRRSQAIPSPPPRFPSCHILPHPPPLPQGTLFSELVFTIVFIAIYISTVFMQLNAWNSFSSVAPMRALLTEPQKVMLGAASDMRGFYDIGQPKDWWHWCERDFCSEFLNVSHAI